MHSPSTLVVWLYSFVRGASVRAIYIAFCESYIQLACGVFFVGPAHQRCAKYRKDYRNEGGRGNRTRTSTHPNEAHITGLCSRSCQYSRIAPFIVSSFGFLVLGFRFFFSFFVFSFFLVYFLLFILF